MVTGQTIWTILAKASQVRSSELRTLLSRLAPFNPIAHGAIAGKKVYQDCSFCAGDGSPPSRAKEDHERECPWVAARELLDDVLPETRAQMVSDIVGLMDDDPLGWEPLASRVHHYSGKRWEFRSEYYLVGDADNIRIAVTKKGAVTIEQPYVGELTDEQSASLNKAWENGFESDDPDSGDQDVE